MEISGRLFDALKAAPRRREHIAAKLGVSVSSLDRWASGTAKPTASHHVQLLRVLDEVDQSVSAESARALINSLPQIREVMHRFGLTSSRNDAIDQLAVLLLFQIMHIRQIEGDKANLILTSEVFFSELPDFQQKLTATFDSRINQSLCQTLVFYAQNPEYLSDILSCLRTPFSQIARAGDPRDAQLWHEVFVGFLSSSFHEEKEFAQYMTPVEVVRFMAEAAAHYLPHGDTPVKVLDPSCGTGSFLTTCPDVLSERRVSICGVDTNERMARLASISAAASGLDTKEIYLSNSLCDGLSHRIIEPDSIDLILTNPPFGAEHSRGAHGGRSVPSEIAYLPKYVEWLKPGGVAAVIVPDSILTNKGLFANARIDLLASAEVRAVISLPVITFAASGTTTKTSVIIFQKAPCDSSCGQTLMATIENVGFLVVNRGSVRKRIASGLSDFQRLLMRLHGDTEAYDAAVEVRLSGEVDRWDASYWLSPLVSSPDRNEEGNMASLRELADLINEKVNPKRLEADTFPYIEISGVTGELLRVSANLTPSSTAPSRARKRVKTGDILISTVRPENRTVGVVPPHLDGAICSTGFAVVRSRRMSPYILAKALRSDEVTAQLNGIASGIAYPAFDASALADIAVPILDEDSQSRCVEYGKALEELELARLAMVGG